MRLFETVPGAMPDSTVATVINLRELFFNFHYVAIIDTLMIL